MNKRILAGLIVFFVIEMLGVSIHWVGDFSRGGNAASLWATVHTIAMLVAGMTMVMWEAKP